MPHTILHQEVMLLINFYSHIERNCTTKRGSRKSEYFWKKKFNFCLIYYTIFYYSRDRNQVMHLLRRYPNIDKNTLSQKYPSVDIGNLIRNDKCRGHFIPE